MLPIVLQSGQQPEVEQLSEGELDDARAVRVDVVGLDLGVRAVPQQALDHRRGLDDEQLLSWE
ncbi:hypothetical protein GCM10023100_04590 [Actinocorallia cavernae]|uniref:Uncharacterized protein n=2 Tax=Actinomycetes TaxID=1760 RepID=A0ABN3L6D7_9ACTN